MPALHMPHVRDGLRSVAPEGDLGRLPETAVFRAARVVGVDLRLPGHAYGMPVRQQTDGPYWRYPAS